MPNELGWIRPRQIDFTEDGQPLGVFSPEDYQKIVDGYGCPRCWQDFGGIFHVRCPVCKLNIAKERERSFRDLPFDYYVTDEYELRRK